MRQEAYFCTVKELDELGKNNIPQQLISHTHLIYSSPGFTTMVSPIPECGAVTHIPAGDLYPEILYVRESDPAFHET